MHVYVPIVGSSTGGEDDNYIHPHRKKKIATFAFFVLMAVASITGAALRGFGVF